MSSELKGLVVPDLKEADHVLEATDAYCSDKEAVST